MNTLRLIAGGAAALAFAAAAHAGTPMQADYLQRADSAAEARLSTAGVTLAAPFRFKARVSGDGTLMNAQLVESTGSRDLDETALRALRRMRVAGPPTELVGRTITLTLGEQVSGLAAR